MDVRMHVLDGRIDRDDVYNMPIYRDPIII